MDWKLIMTTEHSKKINLRGWAQFPEEGQGQEEKVLFIVWLLHPVWLRKAVLTTACAGHGPPWSSSTVAWTLVYPPPCLLDTSVLPCLLASVQNLTWDAPGETTGWQLKSSSTLLFTLLAPNIIPNNSVPDVVETSEFLNNSHFLVTLTSSLVRCQSQGELFCN